MSKRSLLAIMLASRCRSALRSPAALAGQVNVGVSISVPPPPPIVLPAPPAVVVVPNSPVSYAPGVTSISSDYDGRYYTFHDGAWFSRA